MHLKSRPLPLEGVSPMIRLGSLAGNSFDGPYTLAGWNPIDSPGVYAIMYKQEEDGNYAVVYVGHTDNLENRVTNHKGPIVPDRLISGYSSTTVNRAKCATACAAKAYPESRSQTCRSHLSATAFGWNAYSLRIQPEPSRPVGTAAEVAGRVVRFAVRSTTD